jgi:hypothetical protein
MRRNTYRCEPEEDREPLLQMSRAEVDPYYSVREYVNDIIFYYLEILIFLFSHVQSQIERAKVKYEKFKDLVMNTDTSNNPEFKELRKSIVHAFEIMHK